MARTCEICGKGPGVVTTISHAHNRTKRVVYPNLRRVKAVIQGAVRTVRVCTRCIRSGHVTKAG